jgi:radical SAM protein with 4Fe4S-binding SPASM domain
MFRISQTMQLLADPEGAAPRRPAASGKPTGPVVIWNLVRRCNLTCKHCYSISADKDFAGELDTSEVYTVMDDLKAFGVPVLILSGGEPLLRPDIFEISHRARAMGFYVGLSTNGTLIDESNIDAIAAVGYNYVGISIDGIGETHDRFRRMEGAFDKAMHGIRLCHARGIKVGLRFTLTQDNADELPQIIQLMEEEDIDKLYLSHLNYAGRGNKHRKDDVVHQITRQAMDLLFETSLRDINNGVQREFVTGNSSGVNISNIDNLGNVHPDTMWWHYTLGNVRERPFSEIWTDLSDPVMANLKQHPRPVEGRCAECRYLNICNGNTRIRAYQTSDNYWAEDPGCYLSDEEIGLASADYAAAANLT